jgi:hypothetical protein
MIILEKMERRIIVVCSNNEAEIRVKDLFLTFNMPANVQYAKNLKSLFIKYDKEVYEKALKLFMLEIYPKSLPNLGMLKRHLDNARKQLQNQKNMSELKVLQSSGSEKSQWRVFIRTILNNWDKINKNEITLNDYNRNMAKYFEEQKDYEGRDQHLKLIRSK